MSAAELETYKLELQQIEAALAADPENAELKALAKDLKDVIELTSQLVQPSAGSTSKSGSSGAGAGSSGAWRVGDACEAVWSGDGQYYPAVVRKVNGDTCEVEYTEYSETATVQTQSLRAGKESAKDSSEKKAGDKRTHSEAAAAAAAAAAAPSSSAASSKQHADLAAEGKTLKDVEAAKRRRREQKKMKRKEVEQKREEDKNKWQNFNSSLSSKKNKKVPFTAKPRKSIFASPEGLDGKVGVGTCGIGGAGMTDFQQRGKWAKK